MQVCRTVQANLRTLRHQQLPCSQAGKYLANKKEPWQLLIIHFCPISVGLFDLFFWVCFEIMHNSLREVQVQLPVNYGESFRIDRCPVAQCHPSAAIASIPRSKAFRRFAKRCKVFWRCKPPTDATPFMLEVFGALNGTFLREIGNDIVPFDGDASGRRIP